MSVIAAAVLAWLLTGAATALTAPTDLRVSDVPNDDGGKGLRVEWTYAPVDASEPAPARFVILRRAVLVSELTVVGEVDAASRSYDDASAAAPYRGETKIRERPTAFSYVVRAVSEAGGTETTADSAVSAPAAPRANWYHVGQTPLLIVTVAFGSLLYYLTRRARRGAVPKIRRIAGLEAVDEAIGRATEMGRPILYVAGIGGVSDVATIASINIYGHVTKKAGEYGTRTRVPCFDPIVMQVLGTVAEQAYTDIGRPDAYRPDDVFFITQEQFAYAGAVDGIMVRERPAAVFLQGVFYAESLVLAETANGIGAIQIAGTDRDAQLPFFIAACDYTLIGEELFAASAYLSGDAPLLSTIRAQDLAKATLMACLVVGSVLAFFGFDWVAQFFATPAS